MIARLRGRLTYANVTSTLALFIALGGGAYAATLPRNSVGPAQIKKNAVTSVKVKDRSLLARDFRTGQLPAGPRGEQGQQGPTGPKGDPGATTVTRRSATGPLVAPGGIGTATAACQAGERATGGGWEFVQGTFRSTLSESSYPLAGADGVANAWHLRYWNNGTTGNLQLRAHVICAAP